MEIFNVVLHILDSIVSRYARMSCSNCTKNFSFFTRELGCPGCGFSVCSGCLKKTGVVRGKQQKVCNKCFEKQQHPKQNSFVPEPPDALKKRMEKDPLPQMLTQSKSVLKSKSASEDEKLRARLRALQSERSSNTPSSDQVRERLERLKGGRSLAGADTDQRPVYQPPDPRTQVEQSADLVSAVSAEVELESRLPVLTPEQDIEQRLARLRGEQFSVNNNSSSSASTRHSCNNYPDPMKYLSDKPGVSDGYLDIENLDMDEVNKLMKEADDKMNDEARDAVKDLEKDKVIQDQLAKLRIKKTSDNINKDDSDDDSDNDDDESTDNVITRIMAEVRLDERLSPLDTGHGTDRDHRSGPEPEELPWCVICNDDASLRCRDCAGDLFCRGCFRECHSDKYDRNHRTESYKNN